ncbi:hypothetical protein Bca52824_040170 [Brassica carinata]|uniref:Uncharacterized protein n=1 Tax=Brassica carinata TaxID=52824 RepID=A0A8X7RSJ3_BRACI|nr:hypothetical protein Bca52824_040170 [Brassica carinata]
MTDEVKAAESELLKVSETTEETKVSEFVDAQEKIDKSESQILEDTKLTEDKNKIVKRKTKKGEKDTQSNMRVTSLPTRSS